MSCGAGTDGVQADFPLDFTDRRGLPQLGDRERAGPLRRTRRSGPVTP